MMSFLSAWAAAAEAWYGARCGARSRELVDRLAAQAEQVLRLGEILRVAHVEQPARLHRRADALEHAALRRRIEIDHHVAAEHEVERLAKLPVRVHQVVGAKLDQPGELGLDA